MKTTNNVQKTNLKSMVFAAGLIVIGFSVDGQATTRPDFTTDKNKPLAFADVTMPAATKASAATISAVSYSAYLVPAREESLTIEAWMTEASRFDAVETLLTPAIEEKLALESWMTNETKFAGTVKDQPVEKTGNVQISTSRFVYREVNLEEALKVEPWMLNAQAWK
jgi:hypothetical protein